MNHCARRLQVAFFSAGLLLAPLTEAASPAAPAYADYHSLEAPKALAASPDQPELNHGIAHQQSNDLVASMSALNKCEALRPTNAGACEITYLNDERIATGRDILAAVPTGAHPLYLWRFDRVAGASGGSVFVAGSVHVLKASLYPLPQQYREAFEGADHLVVEVNAHAYTPEEMQRKTRQYSRLPEGTTLSGVLGPQLYQRLRHHLGAYGLERLDITNTNPAFLMNQLLVARLLALGYGPEFGVEQHFLDRLASRDVIELETVDAQLQLLFEQPMPVQIELLEDTLDQESQIEPWLNQLLVAWLSGNDIQLETLFRQQTRESPLLNAFTEQLLDQRNIGMAQKIRQFIDDGSGSYFVLIGAAHLVGEAGIISLLEQQGLHGQRITTNTPLNTLQSQETGETHESTR